MAIGTLAPSRVLRRPRRVDMRALVGLVVLTIGVLGAAVMWSGSSGSQSVVVLTRDLPAGARLTAADVQVVQLRSDPAVQQAALSGNQLDRLIGQTLAEPGHAHQILLPAQLGTRPPLPAGLVAMTIGVTPQTAVGGALHPGDQVAVLATAKDSAAAAGTVTVVQRARVLAVGADPEQGLLHPTAGSAGAAPIQWLTLAVTRPEAEQLAAARWHADLDVLLLPEAPAGGV